MKIYPKCILSKQWNYEMQQSTDSKVITILRFSSMLKYRHQISDIYIKGQLIFVWFAYAKLDRVVEV